MKLNILKGFAAIAMLCMIGAVFATPVALGDAGLVYQYYYNDVSAAQVCFEGAGTMATLGATMAVASAGVGLYWHNLILIFNFLILTFYYT